MANSGDDIKKLGKILLIITAVAIAQAISLPEQIQIDLLFLLIPGLGPAIKMLYAYDRYYQTKNLVIFGIEVIYICAMVYLHQWLIRKLLARAKSSSSIDTNRTQVSREQVDKIR